MTTRSDPFTAGADFIRREARVLERRMFATIFEDAPPEGVTAALGAYRNPDGGFGHGLEPDKLCPDSQPLDVEVALTAMLEAGAVDHGMVAGACDFLAKLAPGDAVPLATPDIEGHPHAEHWADWAYWPGINPTAGLAGRLHALGVEHPWRDQATAWCWSALDAGLPDDAHGLWEALLFLEHVDDRQRAAAIADRIPEHLPKVAMLNLDADATEYGVTPLQLAPRPSSRWRSLLDDATITAHLDKLLADQQDDGGWPLTWEPPSRAATLAYRGIVTLEALQVLTAYGRMSPP